MTRQSWRRWFRETLKPYGAELIAEASDEYGGIQVVELGPYRALYFDSPSCQGRIHKDRPWQPASEYLRSLLVSAAMTSSLERVLILGLGPGALTHCLLKLHPDLELHLVELREIVYQTARDHCLLPQGEKIHYHLEDATHFIKRNPQDFEEQFDLIIVDMALGESISPLLVQPGFWVHTLTHLKDTGIICANLWRGSEHRFEWIFNRLGSCLKTPPIVLRHKQIDNMVVFGSPTSLELEERELFKERIQHYAQELGFDPDQLIKQLSLFEG